MLQADIWNQISVLYMFSYGVAVFTVHTFLYGNIDFFLGYFFFVSSPRYKQIVLFFLFV